MWLCTNTHAHTCDFSYDVTLDPRCSSRDITRLEHLFQWSHRPRGGTEGAGGCNGAASPLNTSEHNKRPLSAAVWALRSTSAWSSSSRGPASKTWNSPVRGLTPASSLSFAAQPPVPLEVRDKKAWVRKTWLGFFSLKWLWWLQQGDWRTSTDT